LTEEEWFTYLDTIAQAQTLPHPKNETLSIWEYYAQMHFNHQTEIHGTAEFFPWHRLFVTAVERDLQRINPNFTFPYFDSGKSPKSWAESKFVTRTAQISSPREFRRYQDGSVYESQPEDSWLARLDDSIFQGLEGGFFSWSTEAELLHGTMHVNVGGTMATHQSPLDCIFYSHHAYIDYQWHKAQTIWATMNLNQFKSEIRRNRRVLGLSSLETSLKGFNERFKDVLHLGDLCVEYLPSNAILDGTPDQLKMQSVNGEYKSLLCKMDLSREWLEMNGFDAQFLVNTRRKCEIWADQQASLAGL
jgi:hypothetical protein